jgi:O-succinylbenzoic acid--CoA ligase
MPREPRAPDSASSALPLPDWLAHRAATTPARRALTARGRSWTFAELDAEAVRAARRLATLGARAGDRVATLLHNGPGPAVLVHAALRLGVTLVPLNTRLAHAELAWQLRDAAPRLLVVEGGTAALAARVHLEQPPLSMTSLDADGAAALDVAAFDALEQADVSLRLAHDPATTLTILYTSGTSGHPKGVMLTVGNFWWSALGSALNLGTRPDDRWLACLPLFHVGGLSILLRSAIYGISAVVHEGFDAEAANHALDEDGVTIVSLVPVMLQRMLDARSDRPFPPSVRCVLLGGGPVPRPLLERSARLGVPVVQTYGLTETASQVATLAPDEALRKLGAAGRPLYPNEVRIVTAGSEAAPGEAGEILVRGPVVMAGYAGQPAATARAIVGGWLHTGDVGHRDAEGYLYVLDRRDDLIVSGGENVYPAEVEAVLLAHPWVAEAAVVGVADDTWGQRVLAVVRLGDGAATVRPDVADILRAHCRSQLAGYKVPDAIRVVTEHLPRTASGKLRRAALRAAQRAPQTGRR